MTLESITHWHSQTHSHPGTALGSVWSLSAAGVVSLLDTVWIWAVLVDHVDCGSAAGVSDVFGRLAALLHFVVEWFVAHVDVCGSADHVCVVLSEPVAVVCRGKHRRHKLQAVRALLSLSVTTPHTHHTHTPHTHTHLTHTHTHTLTRVCAVQKWIEAIRGDDLSVSTSLAFSTNLQWKKIYKNIYKYHHDIFNLVKFILI